MNGTSGRTAAPAAADLARRYAVAAEDAAAIVRTLAANDLTERMRAAADAIWTHLHAVGVSWVGFYLPEQLDEKTPRLVLGPCRNKPACSPIELHGVCGRAFTTQSVRIVADVRDLGEDYIACDPRDRSELVIPIILTGSRGDFCIGVLDVDSQEVDRFHEADVEGLRGVLAAAGIIDRPAARG